VLVKINGKTFYIVHSRSGVSRMYAKVFRCCKIPRGTSGSSILTTPTITEDITNFSVKYTHKITTHPNELATHCSKKKSLEC
jgi:hypothetical protein